MRDSFQDTLVDFFWLSLNISFILYAVELLVASGYLRPLLTLKHQASQGLGFSLMINRFDEKGLSVLFPPDPDSSSIGGNTLGTICESINTMQMHMLNCERYRLFPSN